MNVNQSTDRLARAIELTAQASGRASSSVNAAALPTLDTDRIAHPESEAENPRSPGASIPTTETQSHADVEMEQAEAMARFRCLQYTQPACVIATRSVAALGLFATGGLMAAGAAGCGPMSATAAGTKVGLALGSVMSSSRGLRCALGAPNGTTAPRFDRSHRQPAANQTAQPASTPPRAQQMVRELPPMTEAVVIQNPDEGLCLGGPTTGEIALSRAPASAREAT